jgi:hypothetical protein
MFPELDLMRGLAALTPAKATQLECGNSAAQTGFGRDSAEFERYPERIPVHRPRIEMSLRQVAGAFGWPEFRQLLGVWGELWSNAL